MMPFQQNLSLHSDEVVEASWRANWAQSPQRAVGGKLWLTNQRVVFLPHAVERRLGGKAWETPLANITDVSVADPNPSQLFSGGIRSRLSITSGMGTDLFVVTPPQEVCEKIMSVLGSAS